MDLKFDQSIDGGWALRPTLKQRAGDAYQTTTLMLRYGTVSLAQ